MDHRYELYVSALIIIGGPFSPSPSPDGFATKTRPVLTNAIRMHLDSAPNSVVPLKIVLAYVVVIHASWLVCLITKSSCPL